MNSGFYTFRIQATSVWLTKVGTHLPKITSVCDRLDMTMVGHARWVEAMLLR
jgi:hypothetical protein